jgi:hypothetical protein
MECSSAEFRITPAGKPLRKVRLGFRSFVSLPIEINKTRQFMEKSTPVYFAGTDPMTACGAKRTSHGVRRMVLVI